MKDPDFSQLQVVVDIQAQIMELTTKTPWEKPTMIYVDLQSYLQMLHCDKQWFYVDPDKTIFGIPYLVVSCKGYYCFVTSDKIASLRV